MTTILSAPPVIDYYRRELLLEIQNLQHHKIVPTMKVILVGKDGPSLIYTRNKKKFLTELGADCEILALEEMTSLESLKQLIISLNANPRVHGILLQLPLPAHLKMHTEELIDLISQNKDVDGLAASNQLALFRAKETSSYHLPCTPKGILTLLDFYKIPLEGQNVLIFGRGKLVGKPLSLLLTQRNATVTLCHAKTKNIKEIISNGDILILATGIKEVITPAQLGNKRPVIIDVGINKDELTGKLSGDCVYEKFLGHVSAITPVPGGVGPMTILSLAQNLINASKR